MVEVLLGVFIAIICLGVGFFFGLVFSKNPTIQFKITRENVVDYKNFPENVKVDVKKQFEQYQEFERLNSQLKSVAENPDNLKANTLDDIDKIYNAYTGGGK